MNLESELERLKRELERARFELSVFYEITQAMRSTLRLEEILYVILTGITAHQGLGFNRALLFLVDFENKLIKGKMGIGPVSREEADKIWKWIREEKKELMDLLKEYHRIKERKPELFRMVEELAFPLEGSDTVLQQVFSEGLPIFIKSHQAAGLENDVLVKKFDLEEFVIVPLWAQDKIIGAILVDNFVTKRPITPSDIKILNMFSSQAALAIENSKLYEDTLWRSHVDSLTGLWNHGYFQFKLKEEFDKNLQRDTPLSLLMIDIDNFKDYNDKFGHMEGDKVLVRVAEIIREESRKTDYPCRYGGEEFSVILSGISKKDATSIAERIRQRIEKEEFLRRITVSIGVVSFPQDASDRQTLIRMADNYLYQAKAAGKDRVSTGK